MSRQFFAPLVTTPGVITAPGQYVTRSGRIVTITKVSKQHQFGCQGTYDEGGALDFWHKSGRLYVGMDSVNDIVGKLVSMDETQARKDGVAAFKAGKMMAPALNPRFIKAACESPVSTSLLFTAYVNGWTVAKLATHSRDPNMPSVKALAQIESA